MDMASLDGKSMSSLDGQTMAELGKLNFHQAQQMREALENIKVSLCAHCLMCDAPHVVTIYLSGVERYGTPEALASWLDSRAAAMCPCLLDVTWGITHRGSLRKAVREALEDAELDDLDQQPRYAERMRALRTALHDLQPRPSNG